MRSHAALFALPIASAIAFASATPAVAEPFSFRGMALGSSLNEFRRLRFPEAPNARVICTHDAEVAQLRPTPDFIAQQEEIQIGAIICSAFNFGRRFATSYSTLPAEWIPAKLQAGGIEVSPTFWFAPEPVTDTTQPATHKLYRIAMRSNAAYWEDAKAAYIRRYGKPARIQKTPFPGRRGAPLDNEEVVWTNAESTLTMTKRSQSANRLLIVFEHNTLTPAGSRMGTPVPPPTGQAAPSTSGPG